MVGHIHAYTIAKRNFRKDGYQLGMQERAVQIAMKQSVAPASV